MKSPEDSAVAEELEMIALGKMIEQGGTVSLQDQLRLYRFRRKQASKTLRGELAPDEAHPLTIELISELGRSIEKFDRVIAEIEEQIMNSGDMGDGTMVGEGTLRDSHRPAR